MEGIDMPNRAKKPLNRGRVSARCAKGGSITARWESWVFLDPAYTDSCDSFESDKFRKALVSIGLEKDL
jgi:hypothetical protein